MDWDGFEAIGGNRAAAEQLCYTKRIKVSVITTKEQVQAALMMLVKRKYGKEENFLTDGATEYLKAFPEPAAAFKEIKKDIIAIWRAYDLCCRRIPVSGVVIRTSRPIFFIAT